MKDPRSSYNNDAFEELLRQFMLEESANDSAAEEWLQREAERAFKGPVKHVPPADKEQALIQELSRKLQGSGAAGAGWGTAKLFGLAGVLIVVAALLVLLNTGTDDEIQQIAALPTTTVFKAMAEADTTQLSPVILLEEEALTKVSSLAEHTNPLVSAAGVLKVDSLQIANATKLAQTPERTVKKGLLKELRRKLEQFVGAIPAERVYLHTDRQHYLPGQVVWFTAYLRNETDLKPSEQSEVVLLQLLSAEGDIMLTERLVAKNGVAPGQLQLSADLPGGSYYLKAYTSWQQAMGLEGHLVPIQLFSSNYKPTVAANEPMVEFYPEGGYMIAGMPGRVAFKLTGNTNAGIEVYDELNDLVATATAKHDGMGYFELTPEPGATYTARANGKSYPLPKVLQNGLAMRTELAGKQYLTVHITSTGKQMVRLVGVLRDEMYYAAEHDLQPGDNTIRVPLNRMPAGVLQLSLFDAQGIGHAERLVFVNKHKQLNVQLKADKKQYQPHEQVQLSLLVTDDKNRPVSGQFSLAVTDAAMQGNNDIRAGLLLQPDIDQYVSDPYYYFDKANLKADAYLDLLLMTAGWRCFTWAEVYYDRYQVPETEPAKAIIAGRVVDATTGKPEAGIKIQHRIQGVKTYTRKDGSFLIKGLDVTEPVELIFSNKVGLMSLMVNRYDTDLVVAYTGDGRTLYQPALNTNLHPALATQHFASDSGQLILGQVVDGAAAGLSNARVTAQYPKGATYYSQSDKNGFYALSVPQTGTYLVAADADGYKEQRVTNVSVDDKTHTVLDVQLPARQLNAVNMAMQHPFIVSGYLYQRYAFLPKEVDLENLNLPTQYSFPNEENNRANGYYYLNGTSLTYNKPVKMVANRLAVATDASAEIARAENANNRNVERIYTDGSIFPRMEKPADFGSMYTQPRSYPQINYSKDRKMERTDLRSTLYWNGQVITDNTGKASIQFTTSDDVGKFVVNLQGVASNSEVGGAQMPLQVIMPYQLQSSAPQQVAIGQQISIPLSVNNVADRTMPGTFKFITSAGIEPVHPLPNEFNLFPYRSDTVYARFNIIGPVGSQSIHITFSALGYQQQLKHNITVLPAHKPN